MTRLLVLALFAGCATAPAERFYTLPAGAGDGIRTKGPARSVVVGPAVLPDLIDRPQMVIVAAPNRVVLLEQQRWAEPLRVGIPRVVAENLSALLGSTEVSTREEVVASPDCRVSIDVRRFEAAPGRDVTLDALWTVACAGAPRRSGQSRARQALTSAGYDEMVSAYGRALESLSRDIATAIAGAGGASASHATQARDRKYAAAMSTATPASMAAHRVASWAPAIDSPATASALLWRNTSSHTPR
jgi:uncharacterized lipoprotein YmbA